MNIQKGMVLIISLASFGVAQLEGPLFSLSDHLVHPIEQAVSPIHSVEFTQSSSQKF
jgi:hypothetical protein